MTRLRQDHSGVTIPWTIDTKYYSVQVDFWIDETESQGTAELERMIEAGDLDEMGTVVEAVVFCFSKNQVIPRAFSLCFSFVLSLDTRKSRERSVWGLRVWYSQLS